METSCAVCGLFYFILFYFIREGKRRMEGEGEKQEELDRTSLRSCPKPKSKVGCLTGWAPQEPCAWTPRMSPNTRQSSSLAGVRSCHCLSLCHSAIQEFSCFPCLAFRLWVPPHWHSTHCSLGTSKFPESLCCVCWPPQLRLIQGPLETSACRSGIHLALPTMTGLPLCHPEITSRSPEAVLVYFSPLGCKDLSAETHSLVVQSDLKNQPVYGCVCLCTWARACEHLFIRVYACACS